MKKNKFEITLYDLDQIRTYIWPKYKEQWRARLREVYKDKLLKGDVSLKLSFHLSKKKFNRDLDNMIKFVCDIMTKSIYEDDMQVVKIIAIKKFVKRKKERLTIKVCSKS